MKILDSILVAGRSLSTSLKFTLAAVSRAVRTRRYSEFQDLGREGSPLDTLIRGLLSAAFWLLALSPFLIVPAYYLLMSLK